MSGAIRERKKITYLGVRTIRVSDILERIRYTVLHTMCLLVYYVHNTLSLLEDKERDCSWPFSRRVLVGFCSQPGVSLSIDDQVSASNRNEENPVCCCVALFYNRNNEHDHLLLSVAVA